MKPAEITQAVVHYLVEDHEQLPGALPSEHYFYVRGKTIDERERANPEIFLGTAFDILFHLIEKQKFFGWYIPESVVQVRNSGNAELRILKEGMEYGKIVGEFRVHIVDGKAVVKTEHIKPQNLAHDIFQYLRTPQGFIHSAEILGIEGDLEKIAKTLYIDG